MTQNQWIVKGIQPFIIIIFFVLSSPTIVQLTQSNFLTKLLIPILFLLIILLYILTTKAFFSVKGFVCLVLFLLLVGFSIASSPSYSVTSEIKSTLVRYLPFLFMFIILWLRPITKHKIGDRHFLLVVYFGLIESVLGIFQFVLKSPLLPTSINGQQIVSSIYYIVGQGGTGDSSLLNANYLVRASGTMGSGLGLGILCLCCIAIIEMWPHTKWRNMIRGVFYLTSFLTLTSTIIVGLIFYIITKRVYKEKQLLYEWTYYSLWFIGLVSQWIISKIPDSIFEKLPTLLSRFDGIKYYESVLSFGTKNILIGQNFSNRWQNLANATMNINGRYVVDNFFMYNFFDLGLLGLLIIFIAHRQIVIQSLKENQYILASLNLSILIIGFANNISYTLGIAGLITLCFLNKSPDAYEKLEEKTIYYE